MENLAIKTPQTGEPTPLRATSVVPLKAPAKLDLSRLTPPDDLESARVENLTIDGICGVY